MEAIEEGREKSRYHSEGVVDHGRDNESSWICEEEQRNLWLKNK